ncbi:bombyxin-related peptide A-like [Manduca sexta]|uniref:bombyxin-related peptide A-like n=1 Tax=Manduca sexta TaxID=7130 RepID=UPI0018900230|nr:bombyxin-related peptide A-like [Manduca sexta]
MKLTVFLYCLLALYSLAAAQGGQRFCGRRLARTLAGLCSEVDYEDAVKRSGAGDDAGATRNWHWAALGGARGKRGVVEECCERACTLDELITYC